MMKKVIFLVALFLGVATANAQVPLEVGKMQVNARVGLSNEEGIPITLGVDYGVSKNWTIGGMFDFRRYSRETITHKITTNEFALVGNFNYHILETFNLPSNMDLYLGGTLGYGYASHSYDTLPTAGFLGQHFRVFGDSSNVLQFHGQIGWRYFFNDKIAINLEGTAGLGATFFAGLTYKL